MVNDHITIVTGLGRSGTTMMMRMLHHGGMNVVADDHIRYEASSRVNNLATDGSWLSGCVGKAIKILDPQDNPLPIHFKYRFIWMDRDLEEQAKSMVKFVRAAGESTPKPVSHFAAGIALDRYRGLSMLHALAHAAVLLVPFEDVLRDPFGQAHRVAIFVGGQLDLHRMAAAVVSRPPECLPHFLDIDPVSPADFGRPRG